METSKIYSLSKLAVYQKDAIISKMIMNEDAGSVTLFAFDKEQGLSKHSAPYDALVYVLEGKAEITISDDTFLLTKDNMICMPANVPHAVKAKESFKMLLIMIGKEK